MISFASPSWSACKNGPRDWQRICFEKIVNHYAQELPKPGLVGAIMGAGKSVVIDEICATIQLKENEMVCVSTSSQLLTHDLYKSISRRCGEQRAIGEWYTHRKKLGVITVVCNDSIPQFAQRAKDNNRKIVLWIIDEAHKSETEAILAAKPLLDATHRIGFTATPYRTCPKETISLFETIIHRYTAGEAIKDKVVVPWEIVPCYANIETPDDLDGVCIEMISCANGPGLCNALSIKEAEEFAATLSGRGIKSMAIHSKLPNKIIETGRRLDKLKNGELKCVVHVNLLAEGANYPFFRWLCMRREVGARVRFLQEIGRLLRSDEGKEKAYFYDPHDLFGAFQLSYNEALGDRPEEEEEISEEVEPQERGERISEADPPLAMRLIEATVRTLVVACDLSGILPNRKPAKKAERVLPSNEYQTAAILSHLQQLIYLKIVPAGWLACLAAIERRPECIRWGFAADLILSLGAIIEARKWPNSLMVDGSIHALPSYTIHGTPSGIPLILDKNGQYVADFDKVKA